MEETRKFKKLENGKVQVTVVSDGDIQVPILKDNGEHDMKKFGVFTTRTIQEIDNGKELYSFLEGELKKAENKLKQEQDKLDRHKLLNIELLPEDVLKEISEERKKGQPAFKKKFPSIETYLMNRDEKIRTTSNVEMIKPQVKNIKQQMKELKEAL